MKKIKVSIIVPVYNVEKYLSKCLDSLINQTLKDIEIIVINDGSPDNSQEIIDIYQKKYPKLIKSYIKANGGLGDARNFGLKYAKGDYIAYVDSDDWVEPDMYEKLYKKAIADNADIVVCGYNVYNEKNEKLKEEKSYNERISDNKKMQIFLGDNSAWNKIYKKEIIVNNNIKFRSNIWYEDIDFKINILLSCKKISIIDNKLYNYLIRQGSIMNNSKVEKNLDILLAFDNILKICKEKKKLKRYFNEIEFLAILHILIFPITRIIAAESVDNVTKEKIIQKLYKYFYSKFPNYKSNKYLKKLSFGQKIIYQLILYKQYWLIKFLMKVKKVVS